MPGGSNVDLNHTFPAARMAAAEDPGVMRVKTHRRRPLPHWAGRMATPHAEFARRSAQFLRRLSTMRECVVIQRVLLLAMLPIGDSLLITPTLRALRARYPSARLVALTHANAAPVLRCVPALDDTVVLPTGPDWRGPGALVAMLRRLRAERFDVSVDFTSPAYKWISLVSGIWCRTSMKFDPLWWLIPGRHHRWRAIHAAQHYYDCARELDLPAWDVVDHAPHLVVPAATRAGAQAFLDRELDRYRARGRSRPLVGIHAGGAGLGGLKRWPAERFAELGTELSRRWGARCLLLGGPDEVDLARQIAQAMPDPPLCAVGRLPLLETFALIETCDLFIGNDSSLLHAAAALGVPYVGIFGPTAPANFRPIPARPGQGTLVTPIPACDEQRGFVGRQVPWSRPRCTGVCAALAGLDVQTVTARAGDLLRQPASRGTAA